LNKRREHAKQVYFATQGELAQQMLARAFAAGIILQYYWQANNKDEEAYKAGLQIPPARSHLVAHPVGSSATMVLPTCLYLIR
jgi:hypothetical protein